MNEVDKQVIRDCFCEALRNPIKPFPALLGFDKVSWFLDELANRIFDTEHFSNERVREIGDNLKTLFIETEDFSGTGYYTKGGKRIECKINRSLDLTSAVDNDKHRMKVPYKEKYHHWIRIV